MFLFTAAVTITLLVSLLLQLDDLLLDIFNLLRGVKPRRLDEKSLRKILTAPQRKFAVLVPSWTEAETLEKMVRGNFSALAYENYTLFLGVYPNDLKGWETARRLEKEFPRVAVIVNKIHGPTSKPQLLNEMIRQVLASEEETGITHEAFLFQDPDDIVHPYSMALLNSALEQSDLVQLPLFSLKPSWKNFTQGIYADESAESQNRDLLARFRIGAKTPVTGSGLTVKRSLLHSLIAQKGKFFSEKDAAENYHLGLEASYLGFHPLFLSVFYFENKRKQFIATRRMYPEGRNSAIQHKARKLAGIALQGVLRFGWSGTLIDRYFLWRDRRHAWVTVIKAFASVLVLLSLVLAAGAAPLLPPWVELLSFANALLWIRRLAWRIKLTASVYGWKFAALVPLRWPVANFINSLSTWRAISLYRGSRRSGEAPLWTERRAQLPKEFGQERRNLLGGRA
jgi:adsorption protein B